MIRVSFIEISGIQVLNRGKIVTTSFAGAKASLQSLSGITIEQRDVELEKLGQSWEDEGEGHGALSRSKHGFV